MSDIGARMKEKRIEKHLTLEEVATRIGTSRQTIQRYECGIIKNIPSDVIEKIASILNTTPSYLMGWESEYDEDSIIPEGFMPPPKTVKKPRLGVISCGVPIDSAENFDCYDDVPEDIRCDFTLKAEGDSMIGARIHDGDIVYIRQQPIVENGQIAAVLVDGSEKLLKRVYITPDSVTLVAENPSYAPISFFQEDMNRVQIIGRAVGFTSVL